MKSEVESKEKLFKEIGELRQRVAELERLEKDQKFTEDALRESEGKSRMLINATTDFVTLLSPEGFILAVNDEVCKSLNREREDLIGCSIYDYEDIVPPELVEYRKSRINEVVQLKTPIFLEDAFNGRHLDIRIHPVLDMEGNVNQIAVFSRDITEKKQSETKLIDYQNNLRLLTSQLTLAEEKERRRIATDLHDSVGQALSLSYIKLGALREVISAHGLEHEVDGIRNLVERSIEDIHSLTFELYPSFLFELGFEKALECLTEEIQNQHGLSILFKKDDKPKPLDEDVHFLIFRTVRELLINIVKHAKTKKAEVEINSNGNTMRIMVKDDGIGFDPESVVQSRDSKKGFGLFSIQERLHFLGGELSIESKPSRGTTVFLMVPLTRNQKLSGEGETDGHKNSAGG